MKNLDDADATTPSNVTSFGGCGSCTMGICIMNGGEIQACDDCARGGSGHLSRDGSSDDDAAAAFVNRALAALADVRELLWPNGNPNAEWSPDTLEAVARRLAFLAPIES